MEDIADKIKADAMKSGFPSELMTESVFRSRNWFVLGNTYFVDQDEGKGREIDLRCHTNICNTEIDPVIFSWSFLSIEIKKSEKPWVVYTSNRSWREKGLSKTLSHLHNTKGMLDISLLENLHPALSLQRIGRTSHVAFSHDTSTIFGALVGAVKSTIDDHRSAEDHGERWNDQSIDAVFYEPLVVLDGQLFEFYLDEAKQPVVEKADILQYGVYYASPNYKPKQYLVDVVTLNYLDEYLSIRETWLKEMYASILMRSEKKKNA
jgi:hypothetical protein